METQHLPQGVKIKVDDGVVLAKRIAPHELTRKEREHGGIVGTLAKTFPLFLVIDPGKSDFKKNGVVLVGLDGSQLSSRPMAKYRLEGLGADEMWLIPVDRILAQADVSKAEWAGKRVPAALIAGSRSQPAKKKAAPDVTKLTGAAPGGAANTAGKVNPDTAGDAQAKQRAAAEADADSAIEAAPKGAQG